MEDSIRKVIVLTYATASYSLDFTKTSGSRTHKGDLLAIVISPEYSTVTELALAIQTRIYANRHVSFATDPIMQYLRFSLIKIRSTSQIVLDFFFDPVMNRNLHVIPEDYVTYPYPAAKLKVAIIGGGPTGLATAVSLAEKGRGNIEVNVYERRWSHNADSPWSSFRRDQVVTLQDSVTNLMSTETRRALFEDRPERVWPVSANISIRKVEDRLRRRCQALQGLVTLHSKFIEPETLHELSDFHVLIGADGASSCLRGAYFDSTERGQSYALGIALKRPAGLPWSQSMNIFLTLGQTRYLLSASEVDGGGYLNMQLTEQEWSEMVNISGQPVTFGNPGCIRMEGQLPPGFEAYQVFAPSDTGGTLWKSIMEGLKLFGFNIKDIVNVVRIPIVIQAVKDCVQRIPQTTRPHAIAALVGDAAMTVHFWPGTGLNCGIKSGIALADAIVDALRNGHLIGLPRAALGGYTEFMLELQSREHDQRSIPILDLSGTPNMLAWLLAKAHEIATRLQKREEWALKPVKNIEEQVREVLQQLDLRTLQEMAVTFPWPTKEMSGPEILPRLITMNQESDRFHCLRQFFYLWPNSREYYLSNLIDEMNQNSLFLIWIPSADGSLPELSTSMSSQTDAIGQGTSDRPIDDLWGKALKNLKPADQLVIRETSTSSDRLQVMQDVLSLAQDSEQKSLKMRWTWKTSNGEVVIVRDLFAKMVTWIEKLKGVGDTLVQYDPGHAALPWAAARLILQASINDIQTNGAILQGMELVFKLIAKSEVVERLHLRKISTLLLPLSKALVDLYTSILDFLLKANRYFGEKTVKRVAKSVFRVEEFTTSYVSAIKTNMVEVESFARLLAAELTFQTDATLTDIAIRMKSVNPQSTNLESLNTQLNSFRDSNEAETRYLKKTLDDLNEPINRLLTQTHALNDNLKEDERLKIFDWLSTIEYRSHHRSKAKELLPGSGHWLLRKPEFAAWMESSTSSILWLHGIPGSGKSMLVAHVIEYLQNRGTEDGGLAYFYCVRSTNEPERADPVELLRCLLEQMSCFSEDEPVQSPVVKAYKAGKKEAKGRKPSKLDIEECVDVMLELLQLNPVTIIVDGLDECDPVKRQDLLDAFQKIIMESDNVVKIFVSSRDDHDLAHRLSKIPNLYIKASDNGGDIERFIKSRVEEAISKERILCGKVTQALKNTIVKILIQKAEGMFRLASLHIQSLCNPSQIKTRANILDTLEHLPLDLMKSYKSIHAQIISSRYPNAEIADRVIKWLLYARETLPATVFIVAISSSSADQDNIQVTEVLSICCNFVVHDVETGTFRFAHLSVREYFEQIEAYSITRSNSLLAEQCLRCIISDVDELRSQYDTSLEARSQSLFASPKYLLAPYRVAARRPRNSFSEHADIYWGQYSRFSGPLRKQGHLKSLLAQFLLSSTWSPDKYSIQFRHWLCRLEYADLALHMDMVSRVVPNTLFVAAKFHLTEVVATLIHENPNALRATTTSKFNCAQVATIFGQRETIGVTIEGTGKEFFTPNHIKAALIEAILVRSTSVVSGILDQTGYGFVSQDVIEIYIASGAGYAEDGFSAILALLFNNNNRSIIVDERLLIAACEGNKGPLTMEALLNHATTIYLTVPVIEAAMRNIFGKSLMSTLLKSEKPLLLNCDTIWIIKRYRREEWIDLFWSRWESSDIWPCSGLGSIGRRIYKRAATANPDLRVPLLEIVSIFRSSPCLTWEHIVTLRKRQDGQQLLLFILDEKPELDTAAVNMLLSQWDEEVVEAMLDFRNVDITDEIIKVVAGNMKWGAKVMELLLRKEMEMLESME
ncbi:hypothetical protein VTL71DRAFT_15642 [Oculimacula yallundae]|uniref:NACHT domain-containing protein n=1 Tax=Oculimacula yallundae TaxID=86028 RepID=A0ABR4CJJ1_9HELO